MTPCEDKGGYRRYGVVYKYGSKDKIHVGRDYNTDYREQVLSISNGKVIYVGLKNGFGGLNPKRKGWCIMIESMTSLIKPVTVLYGHVIPSEKIEVGCCIKYGEKIGEVDHYYDGETDLTHLHLGCWFGGGEPVNDKNNGLGYVREIKNWIDPAFAKSYLL